MAQRDMTQLDPFLHPGTESSWMHERRCRSRQVSESGGDRERESGYFPLKRRSDGECQMEEVSKRSYRFYERGHTLPSNYILEPKACVPYRNINLGMPSQRRNPETYMQDTWRSESPERYTYHSNFRRGTASQGNSPTRHSSVSPDHHKLIEPSVGAKRRMSLCKIQLLSHGSSELPSFGPSQHTSGRSSPACSRKSIGSLPASPFRPTPSHKHTDSLHLQNDECDAHRDCGRESRRQSKISNKHSLDSEKLYKNLESISCCGSPVNHKMSYEGSKTPPETTTAVNSSANTHSCNSPEVSLSRNCYSTQSQTPQKEAQSRDSRMSPSQSPWQGSSHSLHSLPLSHGSFTSRYGANPQVLVESFSCAAVTETDKGLEGNDKVSVDRNSSNLRRGMEALLTVEPKNSTAELGEVGMTLEDYIVLADIPKIQLDPEEEPPGLRWRSQSPSPIREQRLRSYRYQDEVDNFNSRFESDERGRARERARDRREKYWDAESGRSLRKQSTTSLHKQCSDNQSGKHQPSKVKEQTLEHPQTQGWLSRLNEHGKWMKHWFVLYDTSLKFYRDSEAEESDDLDGEINLTSCVNVTYCNTDGNYGFQIQTKRAVFFLSAMTSRIQRNWVKLLKQAIQSNTPQSDSGSEKENPLSGGSSPCQPPAQLTCKDSGYEPTTFTSTATAANCHRAKEHHQTVAEDLIADLSPSSQREDREGWDRDQAKRLEERNKWFEEGFPSSEMGSRWDSMELKGGSVPVPLTEIMDSDVSRKWAEFENLSFREMSAQSLIGMQDYQSSTVQASQSHCTSQMYWSSPEEAKAFATVSETDILSSKAALRSINGTHIIQTNTAEALHKEALSLRQQLESIKRERAAMEIEMDSPCGPGAPCRTKLESMEMVHQKALQELQEKHAREIRELEEQKDRMLQEEIQTAARAMEVLRETHREELEKAWRLAGGAAHGDTSYIGHMPQADVMHCELDVMSEDFSQKCLQLSHTEQTNKGQETELRLKENQLGQLRRENQELKSKLAEEITRMRYFITGQSMNMPSVGPTVHTASELENLLRAKDNAIQCLKIEISCLQNEVQSLTKKKEAAYERYKEAYVELSNMKGRSQLEMGSLNEHLRLANAAVHEGERQT